MKTYLVTGASKRLGTAIATKLASESHNVILHYNQSQEQAEELAEYLRRTYYVQIYLVQADLSQEHSVDTVISTIKGIGKLDGIVHNASEYYPVKLDEMNIYELHRFMSIHVYVPLLISQQAAPFLKSSCGSIVHIADAVPIEKHHLAYKLSKAALISATQGLAVELAPQIRVNAVSPGTVLMSKLPDNICPLERQGRPEEIADAVSFLLSDNARFITGQNIIVDGGQTLCYTTY